MRVRFIAVCHLRGDPKPVRSVFEVELRACRLNPFYCSAGAGGCGNREQKARFISRDLVHIEPLDAFFRGGCGAGVSFLEVIVETQSDTVLARIRLGICTPWDE